MMEENTPHSFLEYAKTSPETTGNQDQIEAQTLNSIHNYLKMSSEDTPDINTFLTGTGHGA